MSLTTIETPIEAQAAPPSAGAGSVDESRRQRKEQSWVAQVTGLSVILGVMLALAINTTSNIRKTNGIRTFVGPSNQMFQSYKEQVEKQRVTIGELTDKVRGFQTVRGNDEKELKALKKDLAEVQALAGLLPVVGPGLRIKLQDSPPQIPRLADIPAEQYMVHDTDINGIMNELKAAGAKALAISGADPENLQRIIVTSAARCVGPTAVVNDTRLAAPYHILALGNAKELRAALYMVDGIVQSRGLDTLKMIEVEEANQLELPAYTGSVSSKYARPAKTARE